MKNSDRRSFLKSAASGALAAGAFVNLNPRAYGANEPVALALIGARNQGRGVALRSVKAGARITVLCDVDDAIAARVVPEIETTQGRKPEYVKDFRRVLDDKSVDAVIIATPDHWHTHMAIMACQAGKDVFLEKPVSQTIREGQLIRDAARKYNRVMQVGTMRRSAEHFRTAAEYVGSGKLGKICLIKAWMCQVRQSIGNPPDGAPPDGADYDMWLGPAPKRAFNPNRFHYNWRFFWDYGNSELGNQGVHMLDVALWGIQKLRNAEKCLPVRVSGESGIYWLNDAKEVPDTQVMIYDYGDFLLVWELRSFNGGNAVEGTQAGTGFYGTEGALIVDGDGWRVQSSKGEPGPTAPKAPYEHEKNFLECVKSRKPPNADIEIGRLSTMLCHLGNIVHHLKRSVRFDPEIESFPGDPEADALRSKKYRAAYPLPAL
ncbi:MAG TPA: Gfo/Idh/MocA family oxidoreductase [Acidobacteriota bacterium]|nr:Gfo/Idh/MocA family oxidoreductase [Acidobacteriota bacterium]